MFTTINPATGQNLNKYNYVTLEKSLEMLQALSIAQKKWQQLELEKRFNYLQEVRENFIKKKESLITLVHNEMGKSIPEAKAEFDKCLTLFDYYFANSELELKPQVVSSRYSNVAIHFEPLGVIFSIMPWNFPMWQVMRFAIPALVSGNLVALKHSDITAGTAVLLGMVFQTSFGSLVSNIHVDHETAAALIESPWVQAVTFTGSSRGGAQVAKVAGAALKKTVLELGGMDPYLILPDAQLDHAVKSVVRGRFLNAGQSCVAVKRVIVLEAIKTQVLSAIEEELKSLAVAPLAQKKFQQHLHQQVQMLVSQGAKLLCGGKIPEGVGAFYPPTILLFESNPPKLTEELFGPVLVVQVATSVEQAIAIANDSDYGLGGGVFTSDLALGQDILRQLQCGFAVLNDFVKSEAGLPFGGVKNSGYGRELGVFGLREFVNIKTVAIGAST
ncbi:MAG: aldehyde dehydrogenase family protein [Bdellovibrionia bacterium]